MSSLTPPLPAIPKIFVVDDTAANLQLAGEVLTRHMNCDLSFATSGAQALESVVELKPDLILLDVAMPEMSGFEVCRKLKAIPETAEIPVIFLTAKSDPIDIVTGLELGGVDYITKPFNHQELVLRVKTQLKIRESADIIAEKNQELRQLVQILCHDLANPVGAIVGLLQYSKGRPDELLSSADIMQEAAENALRLIDLVRTRQSIEDSNYRLPLTATPLLTASKSLHSTVGSRFKDKEIALHIDIPADLTVRVEPVSFINSVLGNLLTNAAKFSPRGSVVTLKAWAEGPDHVYITVQDQGIGMKPEAVARLFDSGRYTSHPGTEGETGTGYGMPLVKTFVEAFGGQLGIESQDKASHPQQHGTTVTIRLQSATLGS